MKFEPKGIIPAVVTPLDKEEYLNESALRKLVNYLVAGGVHGLFPIGSQGEFYALTIEEKKRIIEVVVEETNRRVPIYAGTGAVTTRETIKLTKMAEDIGVDAVSIITPYFISPSQDELYEHYLTVAKSTKLPILLYNNPGRTGGVNLKVDLVVRLSKIDNIVGIKDSSGDMTLMGEYIRTTQDGFAVLAGRDTLIYSCLIYGGRGAIAATANVVPKIVVEIYEAFIRGDYEQARQAQYRLAPLRIAFDMGTFPVVIKEALNLIGIPAGPARSPVKPISEAKRNELREILKNMGLVPY